MPLGYPFYYKSTPNQIGFKNKIQRSKKPKKILKDLSFCKALI
jgi:hypothetical protein